MNLGKIVKSPAVQSAVTPLAIAALTALLTHTSIKKAVVATAKDVARDEATKVLAGKPPV